MKRLALLFPLFLAVPLLSLGCEPDRVVAVPPPVVPEPVTLPGLKSGVHEQSASIPGGGSVNYTIAIPKGAARMGPRPLIVSLHYGGKVTLFYGHDMIDELIKPAFE